jgi:hypothetical protein
MLDVVKIAEETKRALRDWFQELQDPVNSRRAANVAGNLPTLVQAKPQAVPGIGGLLVNIAHTSTST